MKKFLICILGSLLAGCGSAEQRIVLGECSLRVEVMRSSDEIERGLMYREGLREDEGMFFELLAPVGPETNEYFYMKNMLFPIEMLFFDHNLVLKDVQRAEPCVGEPCREYRPQKNAWYVLEVGVGTTEKCGARLGTQITRPGR